uniref:Integrase catalytic domain-containing protein n=1 Tax=Amphimedon queenslandica TaxID=400682 RepID=A0A1X7TEG4_AMPQE
MKHLSRSNQWWPGLDADITDIVQKCETCEVNCPNPLNAPLHPWAFPARPWAGVRRDHAGPFCGKLFLIVIDAYSKWMDVQIVPSTASEVTTAKLRVIFATFGLPEQVVSDNTSGFTSTEFKQFVSESGIRQVLVSPYHQSSNGLAEQAVAIFNNIVKKFESPMETTTGISPADPLIGRRLRTHLDLLHPNTANRVADKVKRGVSDKSARKFLTGDKLYAKKFSSSNWVPVELVEVTGPLSYHVRTGEGLVLRRHVDHLRKRHPDSAEDEGIMQDGFSSFNVDNHSNSTPLNYSPPVTGGPPSQPLTNQPVRRWTQTQPPFERHSPYRYN